MSDNLSTEKAKSFQEGWRAHKSFTEALRAGTVKLQDPAPKTKNLPVSKNYDCLTLTRKDHVMLYEMGISCE